MLATYLNAFSRFSHDIRMYLITSFMIGFSYIGIVAVLLNLYLLRLGYGPVFIGWVAASTALAFALSSLPAGAMGSYWGNRRVVIAGVTIVGVSVGVIPLAEFLSTTWQASFILGTRLLGGFGFALYAVNYMPYLVAVSAPADRDYVFSIQVALSGLAGFIGSLIAGMMPDAFASLLELNVDGPAPYRYPLYIGGLIIAPAVIALLTTSEGEQIPSAAEKVDKVQPDTQIGLFVIIGLLALTALCRNGSESAARSFFNIYLDAELGVSTPRIGALTALSQVLAIPAALAAPALVNRLGKSATIVWGTAGIAVGLILMALIPHWITAGIGFLGVVGMRSMTRAVLNSYQMEIVALDWRSLTAGVVSTAMGLGYSIMAFGGGYLIVTMGYKGLFLTGAGLAVAGAVMFAGYFRVPRGEYARESVSGSLVSKL
ncbi:MAG: MFS transporter [Chloroflexota bacterium]